MHINRIVDFILKPSHNIFIQLMRYFFVGGTAFVVDFAFLAIFTEWCHLSYILSACLSFIAGLSVNYFLSIRWVFMRTDDADALFDFILFAVIGVLGLGLNTLIMWFSTEILGVHYLISKLASTAIVFFWNFLARRAVVGREYLIYKLIPNKNQKNADTEEMCDNSRRRTGWTNSGI